MRHIAQHLCALRAWRVLGVMMVFLALVRLQYASALTAEEIVEQFFPQRLIDESEADFQKGGPRPFKASTFRLADLDGVGTPNYIVASYTNGFAAAIRVLKRQNDTVSLVAEPTLQLDGIFPGLELVDIEHDGRPEVVASFTTARGTTAEWIFKWTGTELKPITIDEPGSVGTSLVQSSFVDVDGDGVLEIIQPPEYIPRPPGLEDETPVGTFKLYRFDGQKYILTKSLHYFDTFFRRTGSPVVETGSFLIKTPGDAFTLTILNGTQDGKERVSSAVIRLNGVTIAGPSDFNQQVGQLVRQVSVVRENVVEVELRGKPGGRVIIMVEPRR